MFKVSEEQFVYRNGLRIPGFCNAEIFLDNDQTIVIFTEIPSNPGPSVTNSIEDIVSQFCRFKDLDNANIRVIERYRVHPNDLDLVSFSGGIPQWKRLTEEEAKPLLAALNG